MKTGATSEAGVFVQLESLHIFGIHIWDKSTIFELFLEGFPGSHIECLNISLYRPVQLTKTTMFVKLGDTLKSVFAI